MKRRKGFTLIELLAVIVILAIIAVIATPIIVGLIEDARRSSNEVGVTNYIDVLEQQVAMKNITEQFNPSECELNGNSLICDNEEVELNVSGDVPTSGYVTLEDGKVARYNFQINGTTVTNETPLECFDLEQTANGYKIIGYSDSCTKDVIIPKYNTSDESSYLDMYEVIDITFDLDKCIENFMNDTADATEDSATTTCQDNLNEFEALKSIILAKSNYSLESRNKVIGILPSHNELVYSKNKTPKRIIKGYKFDLNKCKNFFISNGAPEEEAIYICEDIEQDVSTLTIEEIENAFVADGLGYLGELILMGDIEYLSLNEINEISANAFKDKSLTSVDITDVVVSVGDNSFCGNNLNKNSKSYQTIKNINLYALCDTGISDSCFTYDNFYKFEIIDKDKCLSYFALYDEPEKICNNENLVMYGDMNLTTHLALSQVETVEYLKEELTNDGIITSTLQDGIMITRYSENCSKDVIIPSSINGKKVIAIGSSAFAQVYLAGDISYNSKPGAQFMSNNVDLAVSLPAGDLTSITMPNTIKYIGDHAFENNKISVVKFGTGIEYIGSYAFMRNQITGILDLSNLTNLKYLNGFYSNDISNIIFPTNIEEIGNEAFEYNQIKGELDLSNLRKLTRIGTEAFISHYSDNQITTLKLPDSIKTIEYQAFYKNGISTVIFYGRENVTDIEFGSSVWVDWNVTPPTYQYATYE